MRRVHAVDGRLHCNAGIAMPLCKANAKLLDMDATRLNMSGTASEVTCKHCLRILPTVWPYNRNKVTA